MKMKNNKGFGAQKTTKTLYWIVVPALGDYRFGPTTSRKAANRLAQELSRKAGRGPVGVLEEKVA